MLSKTYSITKLGRKHLVDLMLSFKELNPYHILNEAKILLYWEFNHSKEFYKIIQTMMPTYKMQQKILKDNDYLLQVLR